MISDIKNALSEDYVSEDSGVQLTDMYKEALANYIQTSSSIKSHDSSKSKAAFEPKQMSLTEYREHRKAQESASKNGENTAIFKGINDFMEKYVKE